MTLLSCSNKDAGSFCIPSTATETSQGAAHAPRFAGTVQKHLGAASASLTVKTCSWPQDFLLRRCSCLFARVHISSASARFGHFTGQEVTQRLLNTIETQGLLGQIEPWLWPGSDQR